MKKIKLTFFVLVKAVIAFAIFVPYAMANGTIIDQSGNITVVAGHYYQAFLCSDYGEGAVFSDPQPAAAFTGGSPYSNIAGIVADTGIDPNVCSYTFVDVTGISDPVGNPGCNGAYGATLQSCIDQGATNLSLYPYTETPSASSSDQSFMGSTSASTIVTALTNSVKSTMHPILPIVTVVGVPVAFYLGSKVIALVFAML